jgi:hypothetical protein
MTQLSDKRSTALRELLVDLPNQTPASPPRTVVMKRVVLSAAALGLGASVLILAMEGGTGGVPEAVPRESSGDPIAGPSTSIGSRVRMYSSLDELIADSGAVLVGTVADQRPGPDGTTVSTVNVERVFNPAALGSTSPVAPVTVPEGATVRVRTFGGVASSLPSAPLEQGGRYLLFLSPTGLPSADEDEFFITGVVAGIYESEGDRYVRAANDGDTLPGELRETDLT